MPHTANTRLAAYGTLGPGKPNHHELADLGGRWLTGTVRGHLIEEGWGAATGYPGIVLDADAEAVTVDLLESDALPDHWDRLDDFEGEGYRRVTVSVDTEEGPLEASIYVISG